MQRATAARPAYPSTAGKDKSTASYNPHAYRRTHTMQRIRMLIRTFGLVSLFGMAALALPLPAHAGGMHVDLGLSLPLPFPVVVAPPPAVVYPASPGVVGTGYYGDERYPRGYWRHPHYPHSDYSGYRQGGWRPYHPYNDPGGYQGNWQRPHQPSNDPHGYRQGSWRPDHWRR